MSWSDISLHISSITAAAGDEGQGDRRLLDGVSGAVQAGEIVALLGPSGSGKSTLLRVLNRLFPFDGGQIRFRGRPLQSWPVTELRRRVAFIAQQPAFFPGTAEENLTYGARLWNLPCEPASLMADVRLEANLLRQPVDTLSGGQQQRLALARSLALDPDALLLDEPTSALDIHTTREIEEMVTNLAARGKKGVIWVTHDPEQARRVSHRILLLVAGRVVADLPKGDFFSEKANTAVRDFLAIADRQGGKP